MREHTKKQEFVSIFSGYFLQENVANPEKEQKLL